MDRFLAGVQGLESHICRISRGINLDIVQKPINDIYSTLPNGRYEPAFQYLYYPWRRQLVEHAFINIVVTDLQSV